MDEGDNPRSNRRGLKNLFKFKTADNADDVTEEEIISMVKEGNEQGVILDSEAEMIHNIFEFGDKDSKDIMTHRKSISAIDGNKSFREMVDIVVSESFSRYPVYIDTLDNIIGLIHIKDILKYIAMTDVLDKTVKDIDGLIHDIVFIPETRNINVLFKKMQQKKTHMVIVVDEYGQTAGLVTMEDIIEEIMGNIQDEYDVEEPDITVCDDGSLIAKGMAPLYEICEQLGIDDESLEEYDTLNGFIVASIDRIPEDGEVFSVKAYGFIFKVTSVLDKMIQSVVITKDCDTQDQ